MKEHEELDLEDADEAPEGSVSLFERLAEQLGVAADAAKIFGDPVEQGGTTVIPVARARWGLGGGSGHRRLGRGEGFGGGGGVQVEPVGYIELRDGQSRYRAIHDPVKIGALIAAGALVALALFRRR